MAADKTLVQGAAMAAPKFVDVAGAFSKNFESTLGDITKATNEANAKRNELINSLDFIKVDENGNTIPMSESQLAIAKQIRQDVLNDINSGDPFSPKRAESISKAKLSIQEAAGLANVHKQVLADMQSAKSELSSANDLDAIKKLNDIKDAKMEKDPKTGELKFNVGGVLKSAQELAAYPEDIIEKPTVPMATVNSTLAAATEKSKTVDPNDPSKYAYNVIHAMPLIKGSIQEQLNGPYGTDFRMHVLSTGDSMYIKSDNSIASKYQGETKSGIEAIAVDQLIKSGKITSATTKEQKDRLVTEFLNEEIQNAYVEGFTKMLPNSKLQPKPEKQTTYKPTALEEEIRANAPIVKEANKFISDLNKKGATLKGDDKVKEIIKKIKSFDPENEVPLLTRGEAFKKFVEMENNRLKGLDEDEREKEFQKGEKWLTSDQMKANFRKAIGEKPGVNIGTEKDPNVIPNIKSGSGNQIFQFDEFNDGTFEFKPLPVNTKSDKSVQEFMVNYMGMSDKAKAAFKSKVALFK
jgi:hypothetical protein